MFFALHKHCIASQTLHQNCLRCTYSSIRGSITFIAIMNSYSVVLLSLNIHYYRDRVLSEHANLASRWTFLTRNTINLTNCCWILLSLQKEKPSDSTIWSTLQAEAKKLIQQSETIEGHKGFEVLEYQLFLLFIYQLCFFKEFCSEACLSFHAI